MRADRRHELKENDLVHALETGRAYLQKHGKGVGLATVAVVVVVLGTSFAIRSREATAEDHWRQKNMLSFEPDVAKQSLESLGIMANESKDPGFVLAALMDQGAQSLRLAAQAEAPPDPEFNEAAAQAFEALRERFGNNPLAFGVAHCGLATVEENAFVLDGDPAHKERAREHLAAIMDNPALHTTPFYRIAQDRHDALNDTFAQVVFAPPPPPEEQPETVHAGPGVPIDVSGQPVRVAPPEWVQDFTVLEPPTKKGADEAQGEPAGSTGDSTGAPEAGAAPPAEKDFSELPPENSKTDDSDTDDAP